MGCGTMYVLLGIALIVGPALIGPECLVLVLVILLIIEEVKTMMMAKRILVIKGMEDAKGKAYPVTLEGGERVYVPEKGIVDTQPKRLVLTGWCYRFVMKQLRRKQV